MIVPALDTVVVVVAVAVAGELPPESIPASPSPSSSSVCTTVVVVVVVVVFFAVNQSRTAANMGVELPLAIVAVVKKPENGEPGLDDIGVSVFLVVVAGNGDGDGDGVVAADVAGCEEDGAAAEDVRTSEVLLDVTHSRTRHDVIGSGSAAVSACPSCCGWVGVPT